jgi:hypothetical protein
VNFSFFYLAISGEMLKKGNARQRSCLGPESEAFSGSSSKKKEKKSYFHEIERLKNEPNEKPTHPFLLGDLQPFLFGKRKG